IAIACLNLATYYQLLDSSTVRSSFPVPFSLIVALLLIPVVLSLDANPSEKWRQRDRAISLLLLGALGIFFPLAQMICFGKTDYRRPSDAVVVFGAGVWADGEPSLALRDRVGTAVSLYHEGLATQLIFSGGPGRGEVHETEAMTTLAVESGVPRSAIFVDPVGLDSWETVRNVTPTLDALGATRVLAVSHFYHLPRVKMAFHRAGREVFTVPASETRRLRKLPYYMLREVIAFWVYYLRPLAGQ
ncbi:MAG: YdcF family protein, partial [Planctomycetota bacterium]